MLRFNISIFELLFGKVPPIPGSTLGSLLVILNTVILTTLAVLYLYQVIMSFISIFTHGKKYPRTDKRPHYIIVTSARNEANVVPQFVESIQALNYPQDKLTIHLIADNCTDDTRAVAEALGVKVYERNDLTNIGKSYALDHYFKEVLKETQPTDFAGFIVLDTDNVLDKEYLNEITKVYVAKDAEVIAAYRNSSNMGSSLAAFGSGYSFLRECSLLHKVRECQGLSSYISGTGFFVSYAKMKKVNGWPYNALIEDIEFSVAHVAGKGVINYAHDAIFYDEQPHRMSASMRQRMRWVKGLYQVFHRYGAKMFGKIFTGKKTIKERFMAYESFLFVTPFPFFGLIWFVIYGVLAAINLAFTHDINYFIQTYLFSLFDFMVVFYAFTTIMSLIISFTNWKRIKMSGFKKIVLPFVGFFFLLTYVPLLFIAPFKKVKWDPIPHYGVKNKL